MSLVRRLVGAVAGRLPAHGHDRATEFLLPRRAFERLVLPGEPALTVVCDDGEKRELEIVEVLERHRARGVFAVSPALIGSPGFLGYAELRQIRAAGHEIAFHGTTHEAFTGFADVRSLQATIDEGLKQMAAEGLGTPATLVYPFGRNNRWVRAAVARPFTSAFTTWFGLNHERANRYALRRVPFGAYVGKLPGTEPWYRGLLDAAAGRACWPTLMLHPAGEGHTAAHDAMLGRLIDHARERRLAVRTVVEHLASTNPAGAAKPGMPGAKV